MTEVTNEKIMAAILELINSVNKNTDSMTQLASKIEDIKIQQNEIKRDFLSFKSNTQASLNALEASQQSITRNQHYLNEDVETMKAELAETKMRAETAEVKIVQLNADLKILSDDLQNERNKYNDLEQYGGRNMLELNNIPVKKDENLKMVIVALAKAVNYNNFNCESCVDIVHRLNSKLETPPIIILFKSRTARNEFFHIRKHLKEIKLKDLNLDYNEKENIIFLNESLTNQNAILFKNVRQACRDKPFKFFWTVNGKIMCRKTQQSPVIIITKMEDIDMFIK